VARILPFQFKSKTAEQFRQTSFQTLRNPFDIHQRNVPHSPLYAAVVRPVQPATLRCLFLIDPLLLAYATDCAAKPDPNIDGHIDVDWQTSPVALNLLD
jgi:hypothetical protein